MYDVLVDIINAVRDQGPLDGFALGQILNSHNKRDGGQMRKYSKKRILPYYLKLKEESPDVWAQLSIDDELEKALYQTLRMKPRRTASGVATITVITKPHPCSGACLYCPNDVRMPKSYLHKEPACQRAERNFFDPYLQVSSRLRALTQMGHACDKIELIILGGSWTDYTPEYQVWFMTELFRALNEETQIEDIKARRALYRSLGIDSREEVLVKQTHEVQMCVNAGTLTYNDAINELYGELSPWNGVRIWQTATFEQLVQQQRVNESSSHRVVGLVVETRPETLDASTLSTLRLLGCTKIQIGVQSLQKDVLELNNRACRNEQLKETFNLLRMFGFKIHTHFMANLYGSIPKTDKEDYAAFMQNIAFQPDEVKLYPCVLVEGTRLVEKHESGQWAPYSEDELVELLAHDVLITPAFTRVSRMIRDISAEDIIAGSKKTNLRQMVESSSLVLDGEVQEIRYREIADDKLEIDDLQLDVITYETTNTTEHFLQWVTLQNKIAGFLRLSLPHKDYFDNHKAELPAELGCAMIREVHVYGQVSNLHSADGNAQHQGLGRHLIERACEIARDAEFKRVNVISSVGTREYYRKLGFVDGKLYQSKEL